MRAILIIAFVFPFVGIFAQTSSRPSFDTLGKINATLSLGLLRSNDQVLSQKLNKSVITALHGELMFGNIHRKSIHLYSGFNLSFAGSEVKGAPDSTLLYYEVDSRAAVFSTELGLKGYLNYSNIDKNPVFLKMAWVHGVNDIKSLKYNNEYNAIDFGIGITKFMPSSTMAYHIGLDYFATRQNKSSIIKHGRMDLNWWTLQVGLTF